MAQFLVLVLQLTHAEAAARVHAAVALGPRTSMLGEQLEPLLPGLAVLQRDGVVSAVKVQMVERAMHNSAAPTCTQQQSKPLSGCSPNRHPSWRPESCKGSPRRW